MQPTFSIQSLSEECLIIAYGNTIDVSINKLCHAAAQKIRQQQLAFIKDIFPAYASIAIQFDLLSAIAYFKTTDAINVFINYLQTLIADIGNDTAVASQKMQIPVCYELGLDNDTIANSKKISTDKLIEIHTQKLYTVFMIGFLPGFAYMGMVDESIAMPRQSVPRQKIEPGSVGIAGRQTGIYPLTSPGGWNIIGRTPLNMFQPEKEKSCLLQPGDEIQFYAITQQEFETIKHGN